MSVTIKQKDGSFFEVNDCTDMVWLGSGPVVKQSGPRGIQFREKVEVDANGNRLVLTAADLPEGVVVHVHSDGKGSHRFRLANQETVSRYYQVATLRRLLELNLDDATYRITKEKLARLEA